MAGFIYSELYRNASGKSCSLKVIISMIIRVLCQFWGGHIGRLLPSSK